MGKYILVEVESEDTAERLYAQLKSAEEKGKLRIAGLFTRPPRKRCECPGVTQNSFRKGGNRKDFIVKRHKKTGLYYCTQCKRVRKGWQSPRNHLDPVDLPSDAHSKRIDHEASIHMNSSGDGLLKNFPLTTRTTPFGDPVR